MPGLGAVGPCQEILCLYGLLLRHFWDPTPLDTPLDPNPNPTVPQAETISQPMSGWGCHNTVAQQSLAVAIGQTPSREPSQYPATVIEPSSEPFWIPYESRVTLQLYGNPDIVPEIVGSLFYKDPNIRYPWFSETPLSSHVGVEAIARPMTRRRRAPLSVTLPGSRLRVCVCMYSMYIYM